jgi:molybdate transport system substrate-binding protein
MVMLALVFLVAAPASQPLRIAAAASLSGVLEEVARASGQPARPTYGASGNLAAQIANGAPFDLFLAADTVYPGKVAETGLADGAPFVYARGKLALWVPDGSPLAIEKEGLAALKDPSVRRIAIGNPAVAPYGKLALEALKAAGQDDPKRLVLGASVGQAAQQAQSGSVQAALLPLSLVLQMPGRHVEVPGTLEQGGVVLQSARDKKAARAFVERLLSGEARKIFARHGYAP